MSAGYEYRLAHIGDIGWHIYLSLKGVCLRNENAAIWPPAMQDGRVVSAVSGACYAMANGIFRQFGDSVQI